MEVRKLMLLSWFCFQVAGSFAVPENLFGFGSCRNVMSSNDGVGHDDVAIFDPKRFSGEQKSEPQQQRAKINRRHDRKSAFTAHRFENEWKNEVVKF